MTPHLGESEKKCVIGHERCSCWQAFGMFRRLETHGLRPEKAEGDSMGLLLLIIVILLLIGGLPTWPYSRRWDTVPAAASGWCWRSCWSSSCWTTCRGVSERAGMPARWRKSRGVNPAPRAAARDG